MRRNLNYWDSVSTLAGEVARPRKTFPRALCIALALVVVMYLGPLMVGLGVTVKTSDWELGYFTNVATLVRAQVVGGSLWTHTAARPDNLIYAGARLSRDQGIRLEATNKNHRFGG